MRFIVMNELYLKLFFTFQLVNLEGDASLVEGYLNETKLLAKLQGNENVVALHD